ncbi:MAG: magnesium/cobalt efflux protein, partial [Gammaproteobacteria bacterium]
MPSESISPDRSPGLRAWFENLRQALSGEPRDRGELLELLRDAQNRNLFDSDAQSMLEGVLQVADMQARDIMIPRAQMVALEKDASLREVIA